jgi:hypothetical protein
MNAHMISKTDMIAKVGSWLAFQGKARFRCNFHLWFEARIYSKHFWKKG